MTARALEQEVANTRFLTSDGGTFRREKLRRTELMRDGAEVIRQLLNRVAELEREAEEAAPLMVEAAETIRDLQPVVEAGRGIEELREHARSMAWPDRLTPQEMKDAVELAGFTHDGHLGKEPGDIRVAIGFARSHIVEEAGRRADENRKRGPSFYVPFEDLERQVEEETRKRNRWAHDEWVASRRRK